MSTPPSPNAPGNGHFHPPRGADRARSARRISLAAGAAVSALTLGGCVAGSGTIERTSATEKDGGIIRYAHLQEVPCVYGGWVQQAFTSRQVLDALVSAEPDGSVVPWIATDWSVSDDRLTWTFTLREDVTFTDGTALDAEAVAYNFDYWMNGGNGTAAAHLGGFYESAEATGPYEVAVHLSKPYSPFLSSVSQPYFGLQSPTALRERTAEENCEQPIGSGPFVVEEWRRGEYLQFTRNEDYNWAPANADHQGPAHVAGIRWSFVQDNTSRYGSLLSGESDAIGEIPAVNMADARSRYQVDQYITPGRPVTLSLNTQRGLFQDERLRKALAYSLDREAIVDSAFLGTVPFEGNGSLSQSTPAYNVDVAEDYPFDLDQANALLDEAGWTARDADGIRLKDGQPLEVTFVFGLNSIVTQEGATAMQSLQEQARATGFRVVLRPLTQSEQFSGAFSTPDSYDGYLGYWTSPHAGILNINYRPSTPEKPNGANSTFLADEQVYQTVQDGLSAATTEDANEHFMDAQQQLSDQLPAIGLYTQTSTLAVDSVLQDVHTEASQGGPLFYDASFVNGGEQQ
ncbi:ABC transporter substrate-binding protein [Micrococcus terreus]|uniref:ABC transporter substrate-binding protein n=1 Tax=Micrococcus terreus TaxID=574650 RepID=UPI0033E04B24